MAAIGIARQSGDVGYKLAALQTTGGRRDTHLDAELVGPMRPALANAFHLRIMQGIDLGFAPSLILRQHTPGEA